MKTLVQTTDNPEDVPLSLDIILFPAYNIGNSELCFFLKTIESKGLLDRLLLICDEDFVTECRTQLKHYIVDDFKSYNVLLNKIESWKKKHRVAFKGILAVDEEMQFQLSRTLARHFGLEFFADNTCSLASNKFLLKRSFQKHNVPTSRFTLLTRPSRERAIRVGFPNVLKVLSGTQSQYIFYNKDMNELNFNFQRLKRAVGRTNGDPRFGKQRVILDGRSITLDPRRQFLLESYVPGEEYSCDFMIQSDRIQIIRVAKKIKGPHFGYFAGYHLLNEERLIHNNISKAKLVDICRKISRALSISAGVCMVDFKSRHGTITVLEASIRPGLSAFNHLMYDICGYTSLALMAMQKMGIRNCIGMPENTGAVLYLYDSPDGTLQSFDSSELEGLKSHLEISSTYTYRDADDGGTDSEFDHTSLLKGYVLLKDRENAGVSESADLADTEKRYRIYEPV